MTLGRTEELLAATRLLDNLNKTGLKLLNGRNVAGKDTHVSRFCGNVDLDATEVVLVRGLHIDGNWICFAGQGARTHPGTCR